MRIDNDLGSPSPDAAGAHVRLVLASGSPRRREILQSVGVPFRVVVPHGVAESGLRGTAREISRALAKSKAEAVLEQLRAEPPHGGPPPRILGADTVVAVGEGSSEEILGKPENENDARRMLRRLSGRVHFVWTGVAVAAPDRDTAVDSERSEVRFRPLEPHEIEWYLQTGEPLDKAGAYGIQGLGERWVEGFRGCFLNIVGLPLIRALRLLGIPEAGASVCPCAEHPLQRAERPAQGQRPGCR